MKESKIQCEKCINATTCSILNPYECRNGFAIAINSNFSSIPVLSLEIDSTITDYELAIG